MSVLFRSPIPDQEKYLFDCPGCGLVHYFYNQQPLVWNGSIDAPTIDHILIFGTKKKPCRLTLIDGIIMYDERCFHRLAGKSANMTEWDA